MIDRSPLSRWLCFVLFSSALPVSAATLFSENYTGDTVGQSTGTWRGNNTINVAGTSYGGVGITTSSTTAPSGESGNPYLYAQNNTPSGATTTVDYFLHSTTATAGSGLFSSLIPADYSEFSASWQSTTGGGMTGMSYYLAVQVDGSWYATPSGSQNNATEHLFSVDLLNSNWYAVSFTPGTSMSLDTGAATVTSGALFGSGDSIDGLGFYVKDLPGADPSPATNYRTIRFDNLTITAAPEPSRAILLTFALGAMFLRRRRVISAHF